jgi:hypothetical protein
MLYDRPKYTVRALIDDNGYVVDASWPSGRTEQLIGVFVSEQFAKQMARRFAASTLDPVKPSHCDSSSHLWVCHSHRCF